MKRPNAGSTGARRLCTDPDHKGPRWLLITEFPPHKWNEDGTVRYVHSRCRGCRNRTQKRNQKRMDGDRRLRRQEYETAWKFDRRRQMGVPRMPRDEYVRRYGEKAPDGARVAVESFRPHWDHIMRIARIRFQTQVHNPDDGNARASGGAVSLGAFDAEAFCDWAGIEYPLEYDAVRKAMSPSGWRTHPTVDLGSVDRIMTAAGLEHVVPSLYVLNRRGSKEAA